MVQVFIIKLVLNEKDKLKEKNNTFLIESTELIIILLIL